MATEPTHNTTLEAKEQMAESLWEVLLTQTQSAATSPEKPSRKRKKLRRIAGVVIGQLTGRNETGDPLVSYAGSPKKQPLAARTAVRWTEADLGREVVLQFERGHPLKPVIMGFVQPAPPEPIARPLPVEALMDGEQLVFSAEKEIVLRCGKASLTLTRAGKILIRGAYLLSRSSGVNRIKGGSVQIN